MARMNRVSLIGRILSEPSLRYPNNGIPIYHCLLRVPRPVKGRKNDPDKLYDDINIIVWGDEAEEAHRRTMKGSLIAVDGYIQSRRYTKENTASPEQRERLYDLVSSFFKSNNFNGTGEQIESFITEFLDILNLNGQETQHVAYEVYAPRLEYLADCPRNNQEKKMMILWNVVREKVTPEQLEVFLRSVGVDVPKTSGDYDE